MSSSAHLKQLKIMLPPGVDVVAVSKGQPVSSIRALAADGHLEFGESRLQEALKKFALLKDLPPLRWHFIGRLQANKVRGVVRAFDVIHSVDSLVLAERISRIAGEENRCPKIFLQVKFREDPSKGGFGIKELMEDFSKITHLPNFQLVGLMTIVPMHLDLNERREVFKECRTLANQLNLRDCSMGMSSDWKEAVDAGATWLRVGSALFAPHHPR